MEQYTIFWFRRDLRLDDNAGLFHALNSAHKVLPIFIFDTKILEKLANKNDARLSMIHTALLNISDAMKKNECNLGMYHGKPEAVFEQITKKYSISKVITNRDYEPYAQDRDRKLKICFQ